MAVKEHAKTDAGNRDLIISSTAPDTLNQILELYTTGTYLFEHNGNVSEEILLIKDCPEYVISCISQRPTKNIDRQ